MSGSADESSEEENIIIPDFEDCKLGLLYDNKDLLQESDENSQDDGDPSQDDDNDESQDFYTILEPVKSEDQELFLQVLENLKTAVYAEDTDETNQSNISSSERSDTGDSHEAKLQKTHSLGSVNNHLSYACRLCSFVTETESKIKEHLKTIHHKGKKRKHKKFYPHISIDENGVASIKVSKSAKSHILRKLMTPNIQVKGTKVFIEKLNYCSPCFTDMSRQEVSDSSLDRSPSTESSANTAVSENSTASVNVPMVMFGKQAHSDKSDTFTLVSSEKQMSLKPIIGHSAISIYKCDSCDYYSNNKNYLKQHMDIVHNSLRPYKCPFCDYAGKRSHALREHLIVHSSERPYECNFCNATFRKKGHLTNHIKLHNNSKTLVKCPLCKELVSETKAAAGLTGHLQSVHGTDKLYGCDLCEFIAASEPDIVEHLREKHLKVNVYHCDKCSFDTTDKLEFETHVKSHNRVIPAVSPSNRVETAVRSTPVKPVWIKCSECGFTGQDSEIIKQHMLGHLKPEQQTSKSDVSGSLSSNAPADLNKNDLVLPRQLFTKCKYCDFKTTSETAFQNHLETHKASPSTRLQTLGRHEQNRKASPLANISSIAKTVKITEPVLVPVSELIQSNIVKPIPITSMPSGNPTQFVQVSGLNSKQGVRFLPTCNFVTSSVPDSKSYVSKTRFTPSNFTNTIPLTMIGNNLLRAVPQTVQSQSDIPEEIGQPPVAKQFIPVIQQMGLQARKGNINQMSTESPKTDHSEPVTVSLVGENEVHESSNITNISKMTVPYQPTSVQNNTATIVLKEIPVPRQVSVSEIPKLPPQITELKLEAETNIQEREKVNLKAEHTDEDKLNTLRKSLANVQELIQQQEKIQRQAGTKQTQSLDSKGIPQKTSMKNVVYYITPVSKQNTSKNLHAGITHDSSAGRFRCTICGYTCEYQRTIKAHIWKHSGNKDVEYPMFQNGPLSIYEGDQMVNPDAVNVFYNADNIAETQGKELKEQLHPPSREPAPQIHVEKHTAISTTDAGEENSDKPDSSGNLPSFIVYEESKISNVAPALAHLIAARTMVGLGERNKGTGVDSDADKGEISTFSSDSKSSCEDSRNARPVSKRHIKDDAVDLVPAKTKRVSEETTVTSPINVVVENVQSVTGNSEFTGMQSQQGSPRTMNSKSPLQSDSGVSELTCYSKVVDDRSASSDILSSLPEGRLIIDDTGQESNSVLKSGAKRTKSQELTDTWCDKRGKRSASLDLNSETTSRQTEESAVTLLSLLKKGPNYNPACPPKQSSNYQQNYDRNSHTSSPGLDDTNSTGDSDVSGIKPKSGISSSLLAVIEQLRERSKSDIEEDKPPVPVPTKKASRRRSRRGSLEDNNDAFAIDNVEQFMCEGELKYRCKLCHYNNESTVLLRQHMRLHKTKQPFECSLCDFIADSSEALQDHMIQHCKVRLYQCKMCPSTFNYKSQLRAHMRAHNDLDILMCDFCDFETRSVGSLRVHMKTHEQLPALTCDVCKCVFISNEDLQVHKIEGKCQPVGDASDDTTENSSFKCGQCDFIATSEKEIRNHKRGHKLVEQTIKKCPYCEYAAASVEQVQHHIGSIHGETKQMKLMNCELCGFVALSIRSLKSHMKRHVNDQRFVQQPLEQYKCNLCGYVCHHLPSLKSHMWRHAADEHYSYEFTNEIINSAIDFDGHTDAPDTTEGHVNAFRKLIHDKLKAKGIPSTKETTEKSAHPYCWVTFRCCQCGFETINKAELNVHMKAHSDVIRWTLEVSHEVEEEDSGK